MIKIQILPHSEHCQETYYLMLLWKWSVVLLRTLENVNTRCGRRWGVLFFWQAVRIVKESQI